MTEMCSRYVHSVSGDKYHTLGKLEKHPTYQISADFSNDTNSQTRASFTPQTSGVRRTELSTMRVPHKPLVARGGG